MAKTRFKGIKTLAEYKRGELTKDILRLVGAGVATGAGVGIAITAPNALQLIDYLNPKGHAERKRIWDAIKYLEKKECICIEDRGEDTIITLTHLGKQKLDEVFIWELTVSQPRRWDKKWRIVMFDLPGGHRANHDAFRAKLLDLGFQMYQQSVYIYPHECREEVQAIAHWFKVGNHVRYIVATEINDARRYAKIFDLIPEKLG